MDILTKGANAQLSGQDAFLGLAVSQRHIVIFDGAKQTRMEKFRAVGALAAVAASPAVAAIAFGTLWVAQKVLEDRQISDLQKDIQQIKSKFGLSDQQILISNNSSSSVRITGGGLFRAMMSYTPIEIIIEGDFYRGQNPEKLHMVLKGGESKKFFSKIFSQNGYSAVVE